MAMSSAASGSLVAGLRFFWDWMEDPAGTRPVVQVHSNTFLCRWAATAMTASCARDSSLETT